MRARARAHYTRARGFTGVLSLRRPTTPPGERVRDMSWLHGRYHDTTVCVGMMKTRYARHRRVHTCVYIYTFPSYDNYYNLIYYIRWSGIVCPCTIIYISCTRCVQGRYYDVYKRDRVYVCLCICVYGLQCCILGLLLGYCILLHSGQENRVDRVDRTCDIVPALDDIVSI